MFEKSQKNDAQRQYEKRLKEMQELVYKWNLTQIHEYVMCKNEDHVCNFLGFDAIMEKFNHHKTKDREYPKGRREFESTDLPERLKKGFDLVIFLCRHPRSNLKTMQAIQTFIKTYMDVLQGFDKQHSQRYREKLLLSFRRRLYKLELDAKKKQKRKAEV